jgi:LPXTG-site transpeptidase (sortase) family protein
MDRPVFKTLLRNIRSMSISDTKLFVRRNASLIFILVGVLLLTYVGAEYGQMVLGQRRLERTWAEQQRRDPTQPRPVAATDDGLMRLSIPKIDLIAVVVEGTNRHSLMLGPGHMKDTPSPGELGNAVITAHRDTFFRHIYELQKGDEILVQRDGRTFRYAVISKHIVKPTDLSVVKASQDSRLTLITCYPTYYIGPAPERLVVTSQLVDDGKLSQQPPINGSIEKASQRTVVH